MTVASPDALHTHGLLTPDLKLQWLYCIPPFLYTGETPTTISTFIGVGVGVGVFLLIMLPTAVILMLVVLVVKRKASHKQRRCRDVTMNQNNTAEVEMKEQGVGIDYKDARRYLGVDNDQGEEDPFDVGCNPWLSAKLIQPEL